MIKSNKETGELEFERTHNIDPPVGKVIEAKYRPEILSHMGANMVAEVRDESGKLTGYRVDPSVDLKGYDKAVLAYEKGPAWDSIRRERNRLLTASDWTELTSAQHRLSDGDKKAWEKYRQQLRDLPQSGGSAKKTVFPKPPKGGQS